MKSLSRANAALVVIALFLGVFAFQTSAELTVACQSSKECAAHDGSMVEYHRKRGIPLVYQESVSLMSANRDKEIQIGSTDVGYISLLINVIFWYALLSFAWDFAAKARAAKNAAS